MAQRKSRKGAGESSPSQYILVLDDSAERLQYVCAALRGHFLPRDYEFLGFTRAEELVTWVEEHGGDQLPLVISDYVFMHDQDSLSPIDTHGFAFVTGLRVLERVKELCPRTRCILYSGAADRMMLAEAFNRDVVDAFFDGSSLGSQSFHDFMSKLLTEWEEDRQSCRGTCFVLMRFSAPSTRLYRELFRPAIEGLGFQCIRQDESHVINKQIVEDITENLRTASLVVADITGANPNVLYELGIAHTLGKPAIIFAQSLKGCPFDVRGFRVCQYSPRLNSPAKIRKEIKDTLRELDSDMVS